MTQPVIVGVAGGSGSGKTTLARALAQSFRPEQVQLVFLDAYYKDLSSIPLQDRDRINYDHPDAFDEPLLLEHLRQLRSGRPVEQPIYDYAKHQRAPETLTLQPSCVIVLEGILVLALDAIRPLLDLKLFVDTPADLRFLRRMERDIVERGRSRESVIDQYLKTVRPMHEAFIEPTRRFADLIVPEGGRNEIALDLIRTWIGRLSEAEG
ncbi:MAG: uridine kinase [Planctomycetota bacterium]